MSDQIKFNSQQQSESVGEEQESHILELLIVMGRHKKLVIGMPIIAGMLALTVSMMMTPIFTSKTKIMPPQQQSSGVSAVLGQLGGLAGAAGGLAGIKNPNDLYVGILESRTIADNLIQRFKLQDRYQSKNMDDVRVILTGATRINNGKSDGLISITTTDKDPKFAADLANAYVDELTKLTQTMAISEASKRRFFFEKQLKETKDELANAELALRTTQEKTGMIEPEGQVRALLSTIAQLKGLIAAKEVQLNAMRTFATAQNPDVLRAQEEVRSLQVQLAKLEKSRPSKDGDFAVPMGRLPEVGVEYVRSLRNIKYYETIFELLAKQYELAKIDEAKESSVIQVLDKAIPAERKSKPRRAMITLSGLLLGSILGIVFALICEFYERARQNPENTRRWQELSLSWNKRLSLPANVQ